MSSEINGRCISGTRRGEKEEGFFRVICRQRGAASPQVLLRLAKNDCPEVPFLKEGGEEESETINQWNSGGIF